MAKRCGCRRKLYFQLLLHLRLRGFHSIINSGIIDNYHFYGFLTNTAPVMQWCSLPTCAASALSTDLSAADPYTFTQDAGAIYWSVTDAASNDGFAIWKVAKQAY